MFATLNSKTTVRGLVACFLMLYTPVVAWANGSATAAIIRWRSAPVQTIPQEVEAIEATLAAVAARGGSRHVLVQFEEPLDAARRTTVIQAGLRLLDYVGDNAYFAAVDGAATDAGAVTQLDSLRCVLPLERAWKLHPDGLNDNWPAWAVATPDERREAAGAAEDAPFEPLAAAYVLFHKDVDAAGEGLAIVQRHGGFVRSTLSSINGLVIELPLANVAALADEDAVMWVEPPLPALSPTNDGVRALTGANTVQAPPYALDGSGVTVLLYDGGAADAAHADFGGRVHPRDTSSLHYHATHVAGIIGGSGFESGGLYRGMATGVTIESYGFEMPGGVHPGFLYTDPGDFEHDYDEAINLYGADISNNSLGTNIAANNLPCEWEGNYGTMDMLIDMVVRGDGTAPQFDRPFRVIWGAGNERAYIVCGDSYHTAGPPACAKNHICVGAVHSNSDLPTSFSSYGPSDDDRLKPDVVAPGCQSDGDRGVTSCANGTGYQALCGTSMSSPTVCGLSALLIQDFRDHHPGRPDFRNSTLKAILTHTAQDIQAPGPDYESGYGSVRIEPAAQLMRSGDFVEGVIGQGDVYRASVNITSGISTIKVTLAWDDVSGVPNVTPVLVNDLDLEVYSFNGTRYYPWTLGGLANPAAPAVRTRADHVNNIEQVLIDAAQPGTYEIRVVGYNVPQGPQPFSLVATPSLRACASAGTAVLEGDAFNCESTASLRVVDCDLNTNDTAIDTATVTIASPSEPGGEIVLLTETAPDSATFVGQIELSDSDAAGVLLVAHGDTITLTYDDANNGTGQPAVVTDTAAIDCVPPTISNVRITDVHPRGATVTFQTNEPAVPTIFYGTACHEFDTARTGLARTNHVVQLTDVDKLTTYHFAVHVADAAGNTADDDNGGSCYAVTTPDLPDIFTQAFYGDFDLDFHRVEFNPDGSYDYYSACTEPIDALPTDPSGGTVLDLWNDDYATISLSGRSFVLYGQAYPQIYIGSNGYITFTRGDTCMDASSCYYLIPRVSGLFADLVPDFGDGSISYKLLDDRIAVTWQNVRWGYTGGPNTFQIELYFDGRIVLAYLDMPCNTAYVGLSSGLPLPLERVLTDFTDYAPCGALPPLAEDVEVALAADQDADVTLLATDDGLPTGELDFFVLSLPTHGTLFDPAAGSEITAVPYVIPNGGKLLHYTPDNLFMGDDVFTFKANDGGVPPRGGDSNVANVNIAVGAARPLYVYTLDADPGWPRECEWQFGVPAGQGGSIYSNPDPTSGTTGANVFGVNLNGPYSSTPIGPCYLTAGPFDLRDATDAELRFQRWLNSDYQPFVSATIEVSTNGQNWTGIWSNGEDEITDNSWQPQSFSLLPLSDNQPTVYVRWVYAVESASFQYSGWNVDDIEIWGRTPFPAPCPGDLDGDRDVDLADLAQLLAHYGAPSGAAREDGDLDGDGDVDLSDLAALLSVYGTMCNAK
jgi:hypothetical protein